MKSERSPPQKSTWKLESKSWARSQPKELQRMTSSRSRLQRPAKWYRNFVFLISSFLLAHITFWRNCSYVSPNLPVPRNRTWANYFTTNCLSLSTEQGQRDNPLACHSYENNWVNRSSLAVSLTSFLQYLTQLMSRRKNSTAQTILLEQKLSKHLLFSYADILVQIFQRNWIIS